MRATPYSTEWHKLRKLTRNNATNRAPPTRPWVQSPRNRPDAAPLHPHQGKLDKNMAYGEGGGADASRAIFSGVEEGEYSDRRIHHASWRFTKQGTLLHQEDDAYHIRSPQRRTFRFIETLPWLLHRFRSGTTRGRGRQVHRQGIQRYPPPHTPFRQSWDHCYRGWNFHTPT